MLRTHAYSASSTVTGPSPTNQHGLSAQELAALRQRATWVYQASIASTQQRCHDAYDRLAASTERIAHSHDILATNRQKFGNDTGEP